MLARANFWRWSFCFGFSLIILPSQVRAGDGATKATTSYTAVFDGSTLTHRELDDGAYAQVNIYVGAPLPVGTNLVALQFLFDETHVGNTSGYITPLLFEYRPLEAETLYTVVGIGKGSRY
jgi:hypothetical protein